MTHCLLPIDFIVSSRFDKETCSCKRSSKPVQRVCGKRKISSLIRIIDLVFLDCSHLPPLAPKEYCDESGKYLITEKFGYALRNMTCKKTTDVERQRISKDIFSLGFFFKKINPFIMAILFSLPGARYKAPKV